MATATASISLNGSGQVTIYRKNNETFEDLVALSDKELVSRIVDFADVLNNCIDDDDIEFDDIVLDV